MAWRVGPQGEPLHYRAFVVRRGKASAAIVVSVGS